MEDIPTAQTKATPAEYLRRLRQATRVRTQRKAALVESEAGVVALIHEASEKGYSLATVSKALHDEGYAILDSRLRDLADRYAAGPSSPDWHRARVMDLHR